jgi:mono/diheme cytochrome c family protein
MRGRRLCRVTAAVAILAGSLAGGATLSAVPTDAPHLADADDAALTARGARIYAGQCASCHGRHLEGQALWQLDDADSRRRAPAHDKTGHSWMHSDEDLFHITKYGRFAAMPDTGVSYMPAADGVLSDADIVAAIAFIKSRWPIGLRIAQAMRNPDGGRDAAKSAPSDWTFPATCLSRATR